MTTLIIFIILNVVNVALQTVKSLVTIKCGKFSASVINAVAYGLYTVVLVYMNCDLELWSKVLVVGGANLIAVYIVKAIEEKMTKEKMWLVKTTIPTVYSGDVSEVLKNEKISFSKIEIDNYVVFDCYCNTKDETDFVIRTAKNNSGKCFATENKI